MIQRRAVVHDDVTDPVESGVSAAGLSAANLITLTATITDGDLDTASVTQDIGNAFKFEDAGPSIVLGEESAPELVVGDSDFSTNASGFFNTLFTGSFGNDGFKDSDDNDIQDDDAITYALGIIAGPSGLVDTLTGDPVLLSLVGGIVFGKVGTDEVFRITVDANTGEVTLDQSRAVVQDDIADPIETDPSAAGLSTVFDLQDTARRLVDTIRNNRNRCFIAIG